MYIGRLFTHYIYTYTYRYNIYSEKKLLTFCIYIINSYTYIIDTTSKTSYSLRVTVFVNLFHYLEFDVVTIIIKIYTKIEKIIGHMYEKKKKRRLNTDKSDMSVIKILLQH